MSLGELSEGDFERLWKAVYTEKFRRIFEKGATRERADKVQRAGFLSASLHLGATGYTRENGEVVLSAAEVERKWRPEAFININLPSEANRGDIYELQRGTKSETWMCTGFEGDKAVWKKI